MQIILAIFLIFASGNLALETTQECQVCLEANDVYCLNQTAYQNCMKGKPFGDVEVCPTGTVCTNSGDVCVKSADADGSTIKDVCGDASTCESCTGSNKYTCVSSTQFARCKSTTLVTSSIYSCEEDEVCYQEGLEKYDNICVPSCALNFLDAKPTCNNNEFTTTTTTAAPPSTPSDAQEQTICEAAANPSIPSDGENTSSTSTTASPGNKFFYTKNTSDNTCSSYLYCQKGPNDTKWTTVFFKCTVPKPYFDSKTAGCVATKPTDCSS